MKAIGVQRAAAAIHAKLSEHAKLSASATSDQDLLTCAVLAMLIKQHPEALIELKSEAGSHLIQIASL